MEDRSFRCSFDLVGVNLAVTGGLGTGDWSVWVRVLSFLCEEFGEMDLAASCKDKLAYFRIKELKDVLTQLGLPKQGKKQDLMDRILALLSNEQVSKSHGWGKKSSIGKEGVAKIIDDTYRKMQTPGATDLASKSHSSSDLNNGKPKEELNDSYNSNMKVCCPCGSTLVSDSMIKCDNPNCKVWQHIGCVIIPEKPIDGVQPEVPPQFYCAVCRINKADPFWVTMGHPLPPVKLTSSVISSDGTSTGQSVERTFNLTRADRERLQRTEFDLQVWCLLLNDKVQFRMQWPQYADLQVNGVAIRTTNRPGSQSLGINGRDDGPVITTCSREGINKICLSRCDARTFCFGIRIAKRLTVQQVLDMVPKEAEGERFEDALARVCRCISGGAATENADSDSDLEVVADNVPVSLRCPMSGSRMRVAGRFKPCIHMGCFDLETFVELNQRSRKWQCPICLKNYSLENVIIDPYFNRITSLLRNCGEDVNEIEMRPDGSWRAKNEGECRDVSRWHLPDGSLCDSKNVEVKPILERPIKQEGSSEGYTGLKLGIKRNREGKWEVSKPDGMRYPSPGNLVPENFENHYQNILPMSSSATGSYRDGEDPSVNQDGGGHFDFSVNNGHELDSLPANFDPYIDDRMPSVPQKDTDIIVLSDSEENITIISPYDTGPAGGSEIPFSINHPGVSERYFDDTGLGTSRLDIFDKNNDHFEASLWPPTMTTTPGFQLFQTGADPPDTLVGAEGSLACAPTSGFDLASDGGLGTAPHIQNGLSHHSDTDMNGSLVDNPLAFGSDDPSLQIFLPSRPAAAPLHDDVRDHAEIPNGVHSDDWISLTLAAGGGHADSAPPNGLSTSQRFTQKDSRMESLADTASLLLSMNDDRPNRTSNGQRADNSFLHPHQPRSVKPRFVLSIDTDSD